MSERYTNYFIDNPFNCLLFCNNLRVSFLDFLWEHLLTPLSQAKLATQSNFQYENEVLYIESHILQCSMQNEQSVRSCAADDSLSAREPAFSFSFARHTSISFAVHFTSHCTVPFFPQTLTRFFGFLVTLAF